MVGFISNLTYIEKPCGNAGLFLLVYSIEYLSERILRNRAAFCNILYNIIFFTRNPNLFSSF